MEYITIIIILVVLGIILKMIYSINIKEIKDIGENNKGLDEEVSKYPSNIEICKKILKKLKNNNVKIEEKKEAENCLYIAVSNKIIIANMRNSFTRIQTISHECLHSVQDKKIQLFNFIYSNIYILYFFVIVILNLAISLPNKMLFLSIYIILGYIYYFVRSYLENDAMIKARFLAKEYMEEMKISSKEKIEKIVSEYDKLNNLGVKAINLELFSETLLKTILLAFVMLIR